LIEKIIIITLSYYEIIETIKNNNYYL
jgi:hypothetical protein